MIQSGKGGRHRPECFAEMHGELREFVELTRRERVIHVKAKAVLAIDLLFHSREVLDFHIWREEVRI
jgi:hypothetical protein